MRRGPKPTKSGEATAPVTREAPTDDAARVRDLEQQLAEARAQQAATAEILRVIGISPTDPQPVFDAIVQSAQRLLAGHGSALTRVVGDQLHLAAFTTGSQSGNDATRAVFPMALASDKSVHPRAARARVPVIITDIETEPTFRDMREIARKRGYRSVMAVPMLRDGEPVGTISVTRPEAGPFTDADIALLQAFANQAVIAIENVRLFNETKEALEQQTATSEILRVISSSPTDVQPVFDTMAANALRLCDATLSGIFTFDGELIHLVALDQFSPEGADALRDAFPTPPGRGSNTARAILTRRVAHIPDVHEDPEYVLQGLAQTADYRSNLSVPMLREGHPIGALTVAKAEPGPFSDKQIALLQTFADQAVIAIENVRLFTELQEKNRALTDAHAQVTEALEQQTATSAILRAISQSPTDAQPVFDVIVENACRLCDGVFANAVRFDGALMHNMAEYGFSPEAREMLLRAFPTASLAQSLSGRAILSGAVVQSEDMSVDVETTISHQLSRLMGFRAQVSVPMLRDGVPVGAITVARRESGLFPERQVALLQTFADQAVIAIENVRLFKELQSRNRDLAQTLDQQTATSDILRVISGAHIDAQPVFDTIVQSAARLCNANVAAVFRSDGRMVYNPANYGDTPDALAAVRARYPRPLGMDSAAGAAILTRSVVHFPDIEESSMEHVRQVGRLLGFRSVVAVPMLHEGEAVGALLVARREQGWFSDAEVGLLKTFGAQAVIAIENVRLFTELQARTADLSRSVEQLTALGEVGRAVSSTLDLETVLITIVSRAVWLSGLDSGVVFEYDDSAEEFVQRVATDSGGALAEARRTTRIRKGEGVLGRTAVTLEPAQVPDISAPGAYESRLRENLIESGIRALLAVPMVREDRLIGCLVVSRNQAGDFPAETIALLRTFATQSALAIQNARLFREIEDKSRQLEVASKHKSEFLANMSHELRTPLNAIIGFSEVLTDRMFGDLNEKQEEYLKDIYASGTHLLSLINDILDLSKIEAGRMELELGDFDLPTAIENALMLVRERAGRRSIALHTNIDNRLGQIQADERKVRQVVLNLLSNAIKFTSEGGRIDVGAVSKDELVEVSVSDTGVGIAPEDQEAVFEEFRQVGTADKKVEGTGLGLTLCRKFVELHGGKIWVKSQEGVGSTFTFTIPVRRGE